MPLSDTELYGNLFLVNMAGFETTATVLTYTLALLAANREIQDWVGEEVDAVWGRDEIKVPKYEDAFPRLVRCLVLMASNNFLECSKTLPSSCCNHRSSKGDHANISPVRNPPTLQCSPGLPKICGRRTARSPSQRQRTPRASQYHPFRQHQCAPNRPQTLGFRHSHLETATMDHNRRFFRSRTPGRPAQEHRLCPLGRRSACLSRKEIQPGGIRRRYCAPVAELSIETGERRR